MMAIMNNNVGVFAAIVGGGEVDLFIIKLVKILKLY